MSDKATYVRLVALPGAAVYYVAQTSKLGPCPMCAGESVKEEPPITWACARCRGTGHYGRKLYVVEGPEQVTSVVLWPGDPHEAPTASYYTAETYAGEPDTFLTHAEAQVRCDALNDAEEDAP